MQPSNFATKHPYRFTALIVVAVIAVYLASGTAATILKLPTSDLYLIANLALAVLGAGLMTNLRCWNAAGFRAFAAGSDIRLYWLPFIPVLVILSSGIAQMSLGQVAVWFVVAGLVGFAEEVFFRGLILRAIAPRGLWKAAIISSIAFSLLHALNLLAGSNPLDALFQLGYTLAIGFGFAAVTLRTGVLWPLVIIHAQIDFASFLASGGMGSSNVTTVDMAIYIFYIVAFSAYGLVMMQAMLRRPRLPAAQVLAT